MVIFLPYALICTLVSMCVFFLVITSLALGGGDFNSKMGGKSLRIHYSGLLRSQDEVRVITLWLDLGIANVGLFQKENFRSVYLDLNTSCILTHLIIIQEVLQDEESWE